MKEYQHIESALLHGGFDADPLTGAVNVPVYLTSTYEQPALGENQGYIYSRISNPTRTALEKLIAELEGGSAGLAFSSGLAAITAVFSLFSSGDKILISSNVYGGTLNLLNRVFNRFGITYEIADTAHPEALARAITPDVKAIYSETPANPLLRVSDLQAVSALAHQHGLLSIADNTFMTPYLQQPLLHGVDLVIHSATKYLGGHSDVIAGLVVTGDEALGSRLKGIQTATGAVLSPADSYLLIRGIKTLGIRLDRQTENAQKLAEHLAAHEAVKAVYYPGLPTDEGYEIQKKQAKNGGGMLAFELQEGYDIRTFFRSLRLVALAESLGGVESFVAHPATMSHGSVSPEVRAKMGISDNLIRFSVGIEHIEDITADIEQAIVKSRGVTG